MSKVITTHAELMAEKARLQILLEAQKELIELDLRGIKGNLKPAANLVSMLGNFKNKAASNPLLGIAVSLSTDILLRKLFFKRAGWVVKTVLPFVLKQVTTNLVANPARQGLLGKVRHGLLGKVARKFA
jgi:hypothetical protein